MEFMQIIGIGVEIDDIDDDYHWLAEAASLGDVEALRIFNRAGDFCVEGSGFQEALAEKIRDFPPDTLPNANQWLVVHDADAAQSVLGPHDEQTAVHLFEETATDLMHTNDEELRL